MSTFTANRSFVICPSQRINFESFYIVSTPTLRAFKRSEKPNNKSKEKYSDYNMSHAIFMVVF